MTKATVLGPKEQQLREMRERQFSQPPKAPAARPTKQELETAVKAAAAKKAPPKPTGKKPQKRKGRAKRKAIASSQA